MTISVAGAGQTRSVLRAFILRRFSANLRSRFHKKEYSGSQMITLYIFGPAFGLPDASPFVTKAELLLKFAKIPYCTKTGGLRKAPRGKLPYIRDGETVIADSTF